MSEGWIKLHRCLLAKSVFQDQKFLQIWIWCLLKATHKPYSFPFNGKDMTLESGQFITGIQSALKEFKKGSMTVQKFRTAIAYLKSTGKITVQSNNKFSIISICNWDLYQSDNRQDNKPITNEQQASNKPITTYKNNNNIKNDNNDKKNTPRGKSETVVFPDSINSLQCQVAWERWLEHKKERRESYKSVASQNAQLQRWKNKTEAQFIAAINYSMAQNYSGIYEEQQRGKGFTKPADIGESGYSKAFEQNMQLRDKLLKEEGKI